MASEIWKPIPGYSNYEASNHGRVRSLPRPGYRRTYGGIILKPRKGGKNSPYFAVYLGRRPNLRVHQAVLLAFVGPRPEGMICCHNNGDKLDNRLENLRYDTHRSNYFDRENHGGGNRGERHGMSKLSDADVRFILNASFDLTQELARRFNVTQGCIRSVLRNRRWRRVPSQ